jgi:soluble lytic murein transglycosylase-like protein
MPRARTTKTYQQTAAPVQNYEEGSGCLSGFAVIPLAVIIISLAFASIAWKAEPLPVRQPAVVLLPVEAVNVESIPVDVPPAAIPKSLSPIFRREVLYWADSIVKWASASDLDPNLVATIMQIESCGDPRAVSSAGAMGLFQVMPYHFRPGENAYNPNTNALRGLGYLTRSLETANGDPRLAMAGYNGGIGVIRRNEGTWSAQTKRYVQYGAPIYYDAISGVESSNALNDWYSRYGASLCRQASKRLGLP